MAGLKTASGEAIDGSFELQVEVEEGNAAGQPGPPAAPPRPARHRGPARRRPHAAHRGERRGAAGLVGPRAVVGAAAAVAPAPRAHPGRAGGGGRRPAPLRPPTPTPCACVCPTAAACACGSPSPSPWPTASPRPAACSGSVTPRSCRCCDRPRRRRRVGRGERAELPPHPLTSISATSCCPLVSPLPHLPPGCYRMLAAPRGGLGPVAPPRPPRGNPLLRRTRLHARWLQSSRSLMEQDVADDEELLLRFKYHCVLDLDPERDELRLALLYEQARWALLTEEIDCTEEEMMLFAALQYHIDEVGGSGEPGGAGGGNDLDDLDTALSNLEVKLGGDAEPPGPLEELTTVPELAEELEIYRPRKLTLRGFRPTWAVLKEMSLSYGRSPPAPGEPLQQLNLRGCEVTPDVDVGAQKFCIKLLVAAPEGMSEIHLRCRDAPQYARWVAGCRLASRGRSLADASFEAEARGVLGVLGLQPGGGPSLPPTAPGAPQRPPPDPRVLLAPRFQRKVKAKQLVPRILEVLHRVGALSPAQARLRFVDAWRALPGFGLAYFLVRFKGGRRDEVLGVGPSRLLRLDPGTGSVTRTWRYSALRQWNINWDTQQVTLELEGEVTLALWVLSAPCQALHEFLGGYLCLGGRQPGQPLDLNLFHKLTGGQEPL
ncbi:unnamed protein product [Bubo scandiacus]